MWYSRSLELIGNGQLPINEHKVSVKPEDGLMKSLIVLYHVLTSYKAFPDGSRLCLPGLASSQRQQKTQPRA